MITVTSAIKFDNTSWVIQVSLASNKMESKIRLVIPMSGSRAPPMWDDSGVLNFHTVPCSRKKLVNWWILHIEWFDFKFKDQQNWFPSRSIILSPFLWEKQNDGVFYMYSMTWQTGKQDSASRNKFPVAKTIYIYIGKRGTRGQPFYRYT